MSGGCTGASASLVPAECEAWKTGFDAMGGTGWTHCSGKREDPCACNELLGGFRRYVFCEGNHIKIIRLQENALSGTLPTEWGNFTQMLELHLERNEQHAESVK